jgi:uncharacterized membrane protein
MLGPVITDVLFIGALVGTGLVSGVFFAVAVSVLPALRALPAGRYVQMHQLLGRGYHPNMPVIVTGTLLADVALAVLTARDGRPGRTALLAAAALLILVVQGVSHLCNVPINRQVRRTDADTVLAGWVDPRPRWRAFHLTRTVAAFAAMLITCAAVI